MKWEYFTFIKNTERGRLDIYGEEFNDLGKHGWEMVGFAFTNMGATFVAIFKQPMEEDGTLK